EMVFIPAGRQTVRRNYSTDMGDNPFSAESLSRLRNVNGEMVFIPAGRQTVGIPREINWDGIPLREEPQNRGINGGIMDAQDGGNILIMRPQETILQMQPKEELTAFIVPSINTQASNSVAIRQRSGDLDALLTESPITTRMQSGGRRVIYFPATNQDEQTEQTTPILYNAISFLLQQQQKPTTLTRQSRAAQAEIVSTTPILATSPVLELRSRRASILDEPLLQSRKNKSVPPFPDIDPIIPDSPFGKRKSSKSRFTERFRLW
ncbi:MAG TPA: hypothetical protein O0Y14_03980, partial [Methanocorpusculum sp.]|nr:hypothetical protein [Methanocorpusculum sp.]